MNTEQETYTTDQYHVRLVNDRDTFKRPDDVSCTNQKGTKLKFIIIRDIST